MIYVFNRYLLGIRLRQYTIKYKGNSQEISYCGRWYLFVLYFIKGSNATIGLLHYDVIYSGVGHCDHGFVS